MSTIRAISRPVRAAGKFGFSLLNRGEQTRVLLYHAHRNAVQVFAGRAVSAAGVMDFYRAHLRVLAPYFSGALPSDSVSERLARECDELLVSAVRAKIDAAKTDAQARDLNRAVGTLEHERKMTRLASYPQRMYLELTDACNLKCPMCTQFVMKHKRSYMTLETVEQLRPLFRFMDLISFVGCGETLFHPQFREIIQALPNRTAEIRIITNGILLTEDVSRFLIEHNLDHLWVSLDSTNAESFEHIRDSKQFDRIIENIRTLQRVKKELGSGKPHVAVNFVARRCNIEQLPDFVTMAHELGVAKVNVGYLQVYTRELVEDSLYYHQELSDRCMRAARARAEEFGIELYLPGLFGEKQQAVQSVPEWMDSKCPEPYQFIYIHADGAVGPCCVNDARLGALSSTTVVDLWNGDAYRRFRKVVNTPDQDLNCKHCMLEGLKNISRIENHIKLVEVTKEHHRVEDIDYTQLETS